MLCVRHDPAGSPDGSATRRISSTTPRRAFSVSSSHSPRSPGKYAPQALPPWLPELTGRRRRKPVGQDGSGARGRLTLVGGVLTHRGDNDTVIKGELTNSRRAKKMTHEYLVNVKRGRAGDGQLLFIARLFTPSIRILRLSTPLFDIPETAPSAGGLLRHGAGHCAANLGAGRQPLHKGAIVHQP